MIKFMICLLLLSFALWIVSLVTTFFAPTWAIYIDIDIYYILTRQLWLLFLLDRWVKEENAIYFFFPFLLILILLLLLLSSLSGYLRRIGSSFPPKPSECCYLCCSFGGEEEKQWRRGKIYPFNTLKLCFRIEEGGEEEKKLMLQLYV